ncbi:methyltransferase domain-containing protein [Alcanivorax sp. VBW004]|uniref:class I SAM-dependent methyltransferase n=1 Tax=Alcanivorax sp. VBW004 TaxID=1287708 RepID=UPI0012BD0B5B|nr:class I SAM-dependent methyltransferase [Alcanivorax sp. VBW004]MTT52093.1 methyltransferase domain-containing protein [Alcanivorax sp. VBW004]HIL21878.1 class I SAM-dependent methyltransferase [Alcanivorax sp.]
MTPEQLAAQLRHPQGEDGNKVAGNMDDRNSPVIFAAYDALAPGDGDRILEIGPGAAGHLPNLLGRADNLHYTGLDASRDMVLLARERYLGETRAAFIHGELTQAPLAPTSMDRIVAVNVVYFWQPLAPALQALFLLLRPGGTLVLGLRDHNSMASLPVFQHGFSTYHGPELQQALEQAGFTDASLSTFAEDSVDVLGDTMHKQSLILTVRKPREATP